MKKLAPTDLVQYRCKTRQEAFIVAQTPVCCPICRMSRIVQLD